MIGNYHVYSNISLSTLLYGKITAGKWRSTYSCDPSFHLRMQPVFELHYWKKLGSAYMWVNVPVFLTTVSTHEKSHHVQFFMWIGRWSLHLARDVLSCRHNLVACSTLLLDPVGNMLEARKEPSRSVSRKWGPTCSLPHAVLLSARQQHSFEAFTFCMHAIA